MAPPISYALMLDQIKCIVQTDFPALTENDEIFFMTATTNSTGQTSVVAYPSDRELSIGSEDQYIIRTAIASGSLNENDFVALNVTMWENDESSIATAISRVASALPSAILPGALGDVSQLASAVGQAMALLSQGSGNPFLGNFTLRIDHNILWPAYTWIPGPGLRQLTNYPLFGYGSQAGWYFDAYSGARYWATFLVEHRI